MKKMSPILVLLAGSIFSMMLAISCARPNTPVTPTAPPSLVVPSTFTPTPAATIAITASGIWNDFDEGAWLGTVPYVPGSYLINRYVGGTSTLTIDVNTNPGTSTGISAPNGLELHGNIAAAGDVIETLTEHGADYAVPHDMSSFVGSTMKVSVMVYSSKAVTVENVFIWDAAGNHSTYSGFNAIVAANTWTQVVVPIGTHLQLGVADTAPWSQGAGTGMDFTQTNIVGFDLTEAVGSYDITLDNIAFSSSVPALTSTPTFTPTRTPTPANTPTSFSTPIPGDWDDFDEGGWSGTAPFQIANGSYLINGYIGGTSTMSVSIVQDPSGISSFNGLQLSGNCATAGDAIEVLPEHGADYAVPTNYSSFVGSTMVLNAQIHASQLTTITNVYIWDAAGNHARYAGFNMPVASGSWTNVVIPIGNHLSISSATSPWAMTAGAGIDWTQINVVGFDFATPAGSYNIVIDNMGFSSSGAALTATPTFTPTRTPTPLNTPTPFSTPIPGDWDDFDEGAWTGIVPFQMANSSYLINGYVGGTGSMSVSIVSDPSGIGFSHGLQLSGNCVTAGDVFEILPEHGADYAVPTSYSTFVGSTMTLNVQVYASQPTTITNVFIWDGAGSHTRYAGFNGAIPASTWTNIVVPIGTHLAAGSVTSPWSQTAGAGIDWTQINVVGFDFTTPAGSYNIVIDNMGFAN